MRIYLDQIKQCRGLTKAEKEKLGELLDVWKRKLTRNRLRTQYYEGKEGLKNLGIAIPEEFEDIDTVIGWPAKAVDYLAVRSIFDGFVCEGDSAALGRIVAENRLKTSYRQAAQSQLMHCCAFGTVGRGEAGEPEVVVNFHSAETSAALWNYRKKRIDWGLVVSDFAYDARNGRMEPKCVMLHSDYAVHEITKEGGNWIARKKPHPMGRPLMEPMPYSPSLKRPFGKSRISRTVMSLTDCAVRSRLRAELGSEFYTTPQKYLLGADDEAFDKPKWQAYIGHIFTAGKDEDGDVPQFGQLPQATMQPHTEYMRDLAAQFAGETCVPMSALGVVHDNPASAEAIYAAKEDLIIEAQNMNEVNGDALATLAKMALCIAQNKPFSELTPDEQSIAAHFKNPAMPSVVSQSDAMVKICSVAPWVAQTEVFLEELGFDDATRKRLMREKAKIEAQAMIAKQMAQPEEKPKEATMYETASVVKSYRSGRVTRNDALRLLAKAGVSDEEAAEILDDSGDGDGDAS